MARPADTEKMNPLMAGSGMVIECHGDGPPVLLVHGLGGPTMWEKLIPLIARSRKVIVPHLPGFGESRGPDQKMSSADHAERLTGMVASLALDRICLVGVSYGGEIAARLATRAPEKISRLVLVCPTGMWDSSGVKILTPLLHLTMANDLFRVISQRLLRVQWIAEFSSRRSFYDIAHRPPDLVSRYLSQLSRPGHARALLDALREIPPGKGEAALAVGSLSLPVTIVLGLNDRVIPLPRIPPSGRSPSGATPPGDIRILRECGHSVPLEKPEELAKIVREIPSEC